MSPCCTYECYQVWKANSNVTTNTSAGRGAGDAGTTQTRNDASNNNGSTTGAPSGAQHKICFLCSGEHSVMACPKLSTEKRTMMEKHIGYRHELSWWYNPKSRQQAKNFNIADYKPAPQYMQTAGNITSSNTVDTTLTMTLPQTPPTPAGGLHGFAWICNERRSVYFDLGGQHNLVDDAFYQQMCGRIHQGIDIQTKIILPHELGHSQRGVPVDLACSTTEGSSIVWIQRWIRTTLLIHSNNGKVYRLNAQLVNES